MAAQSRLMFLNLPVRDLHASKDFFATLGFAFDAKFTDDSAACMVISDQAYVMLIARERFADFVSKPVADASATEAIVGVSADTREAVDELADAALAAGGADGAKPMDYGFMYERSFHDPDGHLWSVTWMSQEAVDAGPSDMARTA